MGDRGRLGQRVEEHPCDPAAVEHEDVQGVVGVGSVRLDGRDVVALPDAGERRPRSREVVELGPQPMRTHELLHGRFRVALRIDADREHGHVPAGGPEQSERRVQVARGDRAEIGAVRVEERDQNDLALLV